MVKQKKVWKHISTIKLLCTNTLIIYVWLLVYINLSCRSWWFCCYFQRAAYVVRFDGPTVKTSSECGFDPFDDAQPVWRTVLFSCFILSYGFRNFFCFPYSIALPDIGAVVIGMEFFYSFINSWFYLWMVKGH
jgi:hypothetical protein